MSAESELFVKSLRETIRNGLSEIDSNGDWLEEYKTWGSKDLNQFNSLLEIDNPFDLKKVSLNKNLIYPTPKMLRHWMLFVCLYLLVSAFGKSQKRFFRMLERKETVTRK